MDNFMAAIAMAADQIENGNAGDGAKMFEFNPKMTDQQFIELCQVQTVIAKLVFNHLRFRK